MRNSTYTRNLIDRVIKNSVADNWDDAVQEWDILDCVEDESREESCICGKEDLYYLFTIQNRYNGKILFPIGSSCIHKFEREDLSEQADIEEKMFRLYHAIENKTYITLNSDFFSRKVLRHLYDVGAFNNSYNDYNGQSDYEFMLKMFNKRNKQDITSRQHSKIRAIIVASIRPYLENKLQNKIRNT